MGVYIVTGAAGFIGSCLTLRLLNEGHQVVTVDNLTTGFRKNIPEETFFLEGDCQTAVGAISLIKENNITLEAELFSLDGRERFYCKSSKDIKYAAELGIEIGENLKKQSKGIYKKYYARFIYKTFGR